MSTIRLLAAVLTLAVIVAAGPAHAALQTKQVENFIASMGPVNDLAEEVNFQADPGAHADGDEFAPYATGLKVMKESEAAAYDKLGSIVKKHGFSSQEEWASVGDAIFLAFVAVKAEEANPGFTAAGMQDIPPEMLEKMPPEARAQFETTMKMVRAVGAVPVEDKTLVKPFLPQIERAISGAAP